MSHSSLLRALCLGLCLLTLVLPSQALEINSGETYCFTSADFTQEENLTGICLTKLPENTALLLGSRMLCSGDILTGEQLSQVVLRTLSNPEDTALTVEYLPIYGNQVAPAAQMHISVVGYRDDAPVVKDLNLETYQNLPLEGALAGQDPEGKELTYSLIRQGKRGTVDLGADGTFLYTPKKNKTGTDSFTFTATDPAGNVSQEATVTIRVLRPNDKEQYADTANLSCRFSAEWLRHQGIFSGKQVADALCFQPQEQVTRGEFLAMLLQALEVDVPQDLSFQGFDQDVPLWLRPYLTAALQAGLVQGQQGDTGINWRSQEPISVRDAQDLTSGILGQQVWATAEAVPAWAQEEQPLNRGQAAQLLYQAHLVQNG